MASSKFEISIPLEESVPVTFQLRRKGPSLQLSIDGGQNWHDVEAEPRFIGIARVRRLEVDVSDQLSSISEPAPHQSPRPSLSEIASISAPEIVVIGPNGTEGGRYLLPVVDGEQLVIGRTARAKCDVVIMDRRVSRIHLSIVRIAGQYFAIDDVSSHGTLHNGNPLDPSKPLAHEDVLELGASQIRFIDLVSLLKSREDSGDQSVMLPAIDDSAATRRWNLIELPQTDSKSAYIDQRPPSKHYGALQKKAQNQLLEPWMIATIAIGLAVLIILLLFALFRS